MGAMKQYSRIEKFLNFLKSWYLCYFTPDSARQIEQSAPQPYLNRTGGNLNNVAQDVYKRQIRHSAVSLLIDMGFSATAIADRVGHESIDITYNYAHLFPSKQAEMADKLNMERSN